METNTSYREVFKVFQNRDAWFDEISSARTNRLIFQQLAVICLFAFAYGLVMGSYHSMLQSVAAGIKVIALFLCSIAICFPSFFIIQQVLGSTMNIRQMIMIVLSGMVLTATVIVSFAPVVLFFQLTGGDYHFLQLLHIAIFIFGGLFGLRLMIDALKYAFEKKAVYPQTGVTVFKIWIIILAFVGIQLSWNLRPFLCSREEEFKLFRKYEGNFYTAVVYSVQQLVSRNDELPDIEQHAAPADSTNLAPVDPTQSHLYYKK